MWFRYPKLLWGLRVAGENYTSRWRIRFIFSRLGRIILISRFNFSVLFHFGARSGAIFTFAYNFIWTRNLIVDASSLLFVWSWFQIFSLFGAIFFLFSRIWQPTWGWFRALNRRIIQFTYTLAYLRKKKIDYRVARLVLFGYWISLSIDDQRELK